MVPVVATWAALAAVATWAVVATGDVGATGAVVAKGDVGAAWAVEGTAWHTSYLVFFVRWFVTRCRWNRRWRLLGVSCRFLIQIIFFIFSIFFIGFISEIINMSNCCRDEFILIVNSSHYLGKMFDRVRWCKINIYFNFQLIFVFTFYFFLLPRSPGTSLSNKSDMDCRVPTDFPSKNYRIIMN